MDTLNEHLCLEELVASCATDTSVAASNVMTMHHLADPTPHAPSAGVGENNALPSAHHHSHAASTGPVSSHSNHASHSSHTSHNSHSSQQRTSMTSTASSGDTSERPSGKCHCRSMPAFNLCYQISTISLIGSSTVVVYYVTKSAL